MPDISNLIANFSGGARPNLYRVEIDGIDEKLRFLCKAAQIPGKTINPIEVKYLSNTVKYAGDVVFEDWTVSVMLDEDYKIHHELEDWMEKIKNNSSSVGASSAEEYFRQAHVIQLGRNGEELDHAHYVLKGLWPSSVAPLDLGFENSDTILEASVTFSYAYWERE